MGNGGHVLKLALSCRKISALVFRTGTDSIIAMADSMEAEFLPDYRAKLNRVPRCKSFWDAGVAAKVGHNLALRLSNRGVPNVEIDADEEASRLPHHRRLMVPFFESLQNHGIHIEGLQSSSTQSGGM